MQDKILGWLQKRAFLLVSVVTLLVFLSGCATTSSPTITQYGYPDITTECTRQQDALYDAYKQRRADLVERRIEIESAYKKGALSESEYLILKNNWVQEFNNYGIAFDRELHELTQDCLNRRRSQ